MTKKSIFIQIIVVSSYLWKLNKFWLFEHHIFNPDINYGWSSFNPIISSDQLWLTKKCKIFYKWICKSIKYNVVPNSNICFQTWMYICIYNVEGKAIVLYKDFFLTVLEIRTWKRILVHISLNIHLTLLGMDGHWTRIRSKIQISLYLSLFGTDPCVYFPRASFYINFQ